MTDPLDSFEVALRRMWKDVNDPGQLAPFDHYAGAVPHTQRAALRHAYDSLHLQGRTGETATNAVVFPPPGSPPSRSDESVSSKGSLTHRQLAGRYEILRELDRGGMGIVYLGRDLKLERQVVLKTPRTDPDQKDERRKLLEREAKTLGKLEANGICAIHDFVEEGETLYVVLPFIPGRTLHDHLASAREGASGGSGDAFVTFDSGAPRLGPQAAAGGAHPSPSTNSRRQLHALLELIGRIARSVHAAHEAGIVHRDLKPGNIMVKPDGEPVVLDFGLAIDASRHSELSPERARQGTPFYMAPEQIDGVCDRIDRRTDVYGLGVVLYEALTLSPPFTATSYAALQAMIARGNPKRPRQRNRAIPPDLEAVCLKAMEVEPTRRYATALAFAEDLDRVRAHQPTRARPLTVIGRVIRRARRNPVAAAALGLVMITGAFASWAWAAKRSAQEPLLAFQRISQAIEEKKPPDEDDMKLLASLCADPAEVESFRRDPGDPAIYTQMQRRVIEVAATRGPGGGGRERLLEPRETVTAARPTFRFEVPDAGVDTWSLILSVWSEDAPPVYEHVVVHSGPARELEVVIPPNVLQIGTDYVWSVCRQREEDPDHPLYAAGLARFRLEPAATRDAILADVKGIGVASFDALVRGNALLVRGFVVDAVAELETVGSSASPAVRRMALSLRAEAAMRLGDMVTFEQLRREAVEKGGSR